MAHRPKPEDFDRPMNAEQLKQRKHELAHLAQHHVLEQYKAAHAACRVVDDRLPRASAVQMMVIAWKLIWKWRRMKEPGRG